MRAVITGASGQDGYYTAKLLLANGHEVLGLTSNLARASLVFGDACVARTRLAEFDYRDRNAFKTVLSEFEPDLIYNFAALASGRGMFDSTPEVIRLNGAFVGDLLEAIRRSSRWDQISFCQASSSEMFGAVTSSPQTEETPFSPKSPYGAAKLLAHHLVQIYRETYGIRCCSAILYNHESVRRSLDFVTKKIANSAAKIRLGMTDQFSLGNLRAERDWGYAPEYVQAMYLMTQAPLVRDYVVASGTLVSVEHLCEVAFRHVEIDYKKHLHVGPQNLRSNESMNLCGNAEKIARELGWRAERSIDDVIVEMVDSEMRSLRAQEATARITN